MGRNTQNLSNLEVLVLGTNGLSGPIPPELGQLTRLTSLHLHGNQLSGSIPVELGNLTGLTRLRIDSDTGLCLPLKIQDTVFGRLAVVDNNVPLCAAVAALRVPTPSVLKYTLRPRPEPSGVHEAVQGGPGHARELGDGGLRDPQLEEAPDLVLLAVEP